MPRSDRLGHDLRNDLSTVLTTVTALLLTLPPDTDERARCQIATIARSAEHMSWLLGHLLDFTSLESHRSAARMSRLLTQLQDVVSIESRRFLGEPAARPVPAQREKSTFGASAAPGVCNSK